MKTRGRPRHPELLTPRQQEVLAFLRRGLTNEEIASALDISVDGVKYHVAEVLRRLDVHDRYEAALVEPGVERRSWLGGILAWPLLAKSKLTLAGYAAGASLVAIAIAGIALLIYGVASTDHVARDEGLAARLASRELVAIKTGDPTWRITIFDSVAMREIASFETGSAQDRPSGAVIAGDRIVVNYGSHVDGYRIDGGDPRRVFEISHGDIHGIAASPDGRLLAITLTTAPVPCPSPDASTGSGCGSWRDITEIYVLDALSGNQLLQLSGSDPRFDGFIGVASLPVWRDDGLAFVVTGSTQSEAPGNRATVYTDGRVVLNARLDYFVPNNASRIATGAIQQCENVNLRRHEIRIEDIESSHVLIAQVSDDHRVFFPFEWSPAGSELLYFTEAYPGGRGDKSCQWDAATTEWSILNIDGTLTSGVDPREVHRRWFGSGAVEFECRPSVQLLNGYCPDAQYATKAFINGQPIAEGPDIRILSRTAGF